MFPAAARLRARTPAMIASAITPAPTTPRVEPRRGLICGLYELDLNLPELLTDERMFVRLTQNCGRCRSDAGDKFPTGGISRRGRPIPPPAEDGPPGGRARGCA